MRRPDEGGLAAIGAVAVAVAAGRAGLDGRCRGSSDRAIATATMTVGRLDCSGDLRHAGGVLGGGEWCT